MREVFDKNGNRLPDAERLTRIGKFLRSTSLDELPEILNVIRGDMSIVGPRPLLMQYLELYTAEQYRRHEVKPGITGWAQINGRNAISWEEKFKLDVWYVENQSVWLDCKIIATTLRKIISREGINQPGEATMEEFNPHNSKKNVYKFSEDMQ
jgi:lipopolysaccharide/colanic/teichoic acid biosynthesis glycosyltransferase